MTSRVSLVTLGCARNEVDSEELAARLAADGLELTADAESAEAVLVNTCGFIAAAKKDSIDTLLAAADLKESSQVRAVIAVGCLAERHGAELAPELPEIDAILGFDDYAQIAERVRGVLAGERPAPPTPQDRRLLLPIAPAERPHLSRALGAAPASGPPVVRQRIAKSPMAPIKVAGGCDRRCSFCAIPAFRGAFQSRTVAEIVAEARWLAADGVSELFLVSENTTSYGKDLGDIRALDRLLRQLAAVPGVRRVRTSYLQPAEVRPDLVRTIASTPGVASYFDLSFQHASAQVLRRMRRFGDGEAFLELIERIRAQSPQAGIRSNFIVGFPGETDSDIDALCEFLVAARLDAVGVFAYSDEPGTQAEQLGEKLSEPEIEGRRTQVAALCELLMNERAADRVGDEVVVLIEELDEHKAIGRAEHQGPEVDGVVVLPASQDGSSRSRLREGDWVTAKVVGTAGVDLMAQALDVL